jgi:protoporphyrin/coproporphyrin ferrochelatase
MLLLSSVMNPITYLIVNFGGPRTLKEVEPFLEALLTDKDVIRTKFPQVFHNILFGRIARKRAKIICHDYEKIGGGSPIWTDTEYVASELRHQLQAPVLTFHRYLPSTHAAFIEEVESLDSTEVRVFPMFPQFTYATTGSIARFFLKHFTSHTLQKLKWVKSYPSHPAYIEATINTIRDFLSNKGLNVSEVFFLFSAHGLPQTFIDEGDLYEYECRASFDGVMKAFPRGEGMLCFQSKFGPGEWLKPYTVDVCKQIQLYAHGRKHCLFVPISFTSDHIETLFEVEEQYMPLIAPQGLSAFRVPALNRRPDWIAAIPKILTETTPCSTSMLVR